MGQNIFQRYEYKYLIDRAQYRAFLHSAAGRLVPDEYGAYTVCNLYYDTDRFDLARLSIEKPVSKEKLRLRSYVRAEPHTPVFLELKKKYKGVVYKRRVTLPYAEAKHVLKHGAGDRADAQILREVDYFLQKYPVTEKVFLCYDRTAFTGADDGRLRLTFDTNIRFRRSELRLDDGTWGTDLLGPGLLLMEVKLTHAFPLWLSGVLSEHAILPTSYSKYGTCYRRYIAAELRAGEEVAVSA